MTCDHPACAADPTHEAITYGPVRGPASAMQVTFWCDRHAPKGAAPLDPSRPAAGG